MIRRCISLFTVLFILAGLIPAVAFADYLDNWTKAETPVSGVKGITFGNNKFVAVGNGGAIVSSSDGNNWVKSNSNGLGTLYGVTYGSGKFVAVGSDQPGSAYIMTSNDGVNWKGGYPSKTTNDSAPYLEGVAYGNGKFVAVAAGGTILISSDGAERSWTKLLVGSWYNLKSVTFGNGKFVAIGTNFDGVQTNNFILTSSDGVKWAGSQLEVRYKKIYGVGFGNGLFTLLSEGLIFTSRDGAKWTPYSVNQIQYFYSSAYGNGTFVVPGTSTVYSSTNGTNWVEHSSIFPFTFGTKIAFGNNTFVVSADGGIRYTRPTYTVTYNGTGSTGGTVPGISKPYEYNSPVTVSANTGGLVNKGYTFVGWNTTVDGSGTSYPVNAVFSMGKEDITLYAQWTTNPTYTVTYNANGSTGGDVPTDDNSYAQSASVTVSGNIGKLEKSGNTLTGWNTAADGSGTSYAANVEFRMGAENLTLYAQWTSNPTYNVSYDGNGSIGGSLPEDSNSYMETASVTVLENLWNLENAGYTFAGWNTTPDGSGTSYKEGSQFNMGKTNVTLYAKWTKNQTHTITYNGNGSTEGTVPTDTNTYEQDAIGMAADNTGSLVKTGYTFKGWNTAADGSGTSYDVNTIFSMVAKDMTLYAQWSKNATYTVSYSGNGSTGGTVPMDNHKYEQNAIATVLDITGSLVNGDMTFTGWSTTADGSGSSYYAGYDLLLETTNVTLYAQWTTNQTYTVTYNGNGSTGGNTPTDTNAYESNATATVFGNTEDLVNTGKTFIGWDTAANGSGTRYLADTELTIETTNVTLYAQWTANPTFTVSYNGNGSTGGSAPKDSNAYVQNASVTVPGDAGSLVKTGSTFAGWNTAADGSGISYADNDTFKMGTANVSLFAQWEIKLDQPKDAEDDNNKEFQFSDISGHWAEANIKQAVKDQIVSGYPDRTFKPDKTVTRAEFAVMLINALKSQGKEAELTFADKDKIADWARSAVAKAVTAGIITGYEDGTFRPTSEITRAEMAVMIARALKLALPTNSATDFSDDSSIPSWSKGAVGELKKLGIVGGKGANEFDPSAQTTRAESITVLLRMLAQMNK